MRLLVLSEGWLHVLRLLLLRCVQLTARSLATIVHVAQNISQPLLGSTDRTWGHTLVKSHIQLRVRLDFLYRSVGGLGDA